MYRTALEKLLQKTRQRLLDQAIEAGLIRPDPLWHGITIRNPMVPYSRQKARPGALVRIELTNGAHGHHELYAVDEWSVSYNGNVFDIETGRAVGISRWHSSTAQITHIEDL